MNDKAISRNDAIHLVCTVDRRYLFKSEQKNKFRLIPGISRKAFKDLIDGLDNLPPVTPQEPDTKALSEELRKVREGITDEKVLIGYNLAVSICNKYLAERGEKDG